MSSGWFDSTEPSLSTSLQGKQRHAGCLCTSSGWFKHIEPHRTFSNHIITEIARCVEFCHMSSGWFDCSEPSLSTSLRGKQGVQGAYALVRGGSSTSNLHCKVCRVLSHEFGVVRPYRTFSVYIVTGETRSAGCLLTSLGWFKHIEPTATKMKKSLRKKITCDTGWVSTY